MTFWHWIIYGLMAFVLIALVILYVSGALEPYEDESKTFSPKARRGIRGMAQRRKDRNERTSDPR